MTKPPDPDEPLVEFDVHEAGAPAKKWVLAIFPDHLGFESADGTWHEIDRADVPERVQAVDRALFLRRVVFVTVRKKRLLFQLSPAAFDALRAWIGPPTFEDLKVALRQRLRWVTPIGLLFVFAALPIGDLEWDPVALALGLGLILTGRLAKLWPHRVFFAVDAFWFLCLAANSAWILSQEWTWLRLALLVVQLLLARNGLKEYRRFAPPRGPDADAQEQDADDRDRWER